MNEPSVSIVLPTYNRLEFLRASVESVFAQSYRNWTLIIADDGSQEPTCAYLRSLTERQQVQVLWLPHGGNPAAVRNAALRVAAGEYVAFLDSDDLWLPNKLERQVASLRSRTRERWGYTGYVRIDANGDPRVYPGTRQWVPHRGAIVEALLTLDAEVSTPAVIVERQLLEEVGGFDETLLLFEDYELWIRLACRSDIDLIDEPLTKLRSHDQHYSGGSLRTIKNRLQLLNKMQHLVCDRGLQFLIGKLRAEDTLRLASVLADIDRRDAMGVLLAGCRQSWGHLDWWSGMPRPVLKILAPPALLGWQRARRRT
jgi:glycosyltransferase involved in cell wall biosynthesis